MSLLLIGANHRTAPLAVRERLVFPEPDLPASLTRLHGLPAVAEAMVLSTCNRTEVLVHAETRLEQVVQSIKGFLSGERQLDPEELDRILYVKEGREAVRHLFRVGAGLDSMILGEPQILGQVKDAFALAGQIGTVGANLQALMQRVFSVAKRVRTDTELGRNPVSVSYAAVDLAHKIFGQLGDHEILLLGAGETAELAARHLVSQGIRAMFVANRTFRRAEELAEKFQAQAVRYDQFLEYLVRVDILITSTSAPHPILRRDDALQVIRLRRNRPLFLIDLAVPRDVEPSVNEIDNIYLYDVDDLQHVADAGLESRRVAAEQAERLIDAEVMDYERWARSQQVSPTIVALRDKLHGLRATEFERFQARLQDLEPQQRRAVEELASSLINKVLHGPIRHLKQAAASTNGHDRVELVKQLFGLAGPDEDVASAPAGDGGEADSEPGPGEARR